MSEEKIFDIIKGAILLEYRGKALYESVASTTKSESVKELFEFLATEEEIHIKMLEKQFKKMTSGEKSDLGDITTSDLQTGDRIVTDKIVDEISGAGYEAAVISAALEFEKNAVEYYSKHSNTTKNTGEKKLYIWLTEWEKTHMALLAELDNEIKEQIWYDNSFWPL